jgi:MFS family permease
VRPWSSLLVRDFALLWSSSVASAVAVQVRNVASLYQVYELSGSSLQLGLAGFFHALPFILFGLFAGAVADAFDRKKLLALAYSLNALPTLALAALTFTGAIQVWHIYALGLLGALLEVFSWPARSSLVPRLVSPRLLMNAVTLNTMVLQTSFLVGPAVGGWVIDRAGLALTYLGCAAAIVPAVAVVMAIRAPGAPESARRRVDLRSLLEGLEFVRAERIVLSLFLLDFGVTLVGFYRPILPVFASDIFQVGATGLGTLYAAPALGSLLGSALVLVLGDVKRKGALAVVAALCFGASLAMLGAAGRFWTAVAAVLALGFTDSISVAVRRTVVQLVAPDSMLGRANSLVTVFAQSTNALGALLAGAAAELLGAQRALLLGSFLCVAIVIAISRAMPQLWRYGSE